MGGPVLGGQPETLGLQAKGTKSFMLEGFDFCLEVEFVVSIYPSCCGNHSKTADLYRRLFSVRVEDG